MELGITRDLFLLLKKGKNGFPMGARYNAGSFDSDVKAWLLDLCKIKSETPVANPLEFPKLFDGTKTTDQLSQMRKTIAAYRDQLEGDYKRLLESVRKASTHIPNPMLSSMLSKMGVAKDENQYYKQTHEQMFSLQKAVVSNLQSAIEKIDTFTSNKGSGSRSAAAAAGAGPARAGPENALVARYTNVMGHPPIGMGPPVTQANINAMSARLASLRRGGKRKTKKRSTKKRSTRRRKI